MFLAKAFQKVTLLARRFKFSWGYDHVFWLFI